MLLTFIVLSIQKKNALEMDVKHKDPTYIDYFYKDKYLRICYGFSAVADVFLCLVGLIATALGAFLVLFKGDNRALVAIMLIASFLASSIREGMELKNCRRAYAKAFREIEYALDLYNLSERTVQDKQLLAEANKRAQQYIESLYE